MTPVHVQPHPRVLKAATAKKNWLRNGGVLGHRIHAKTSQKAASEKALTMVSENRYTYPMIDVFRTVILSLLASTGNNVQVSFLVHQVLCTSATGSWYRRVFTQFSLHVWVPDYTCRPMTYHCWCLCCVQLIASWWSHLVPLNKGWILYFLDFFPPSNRSCTTRMSAAKQN